MSLTAEDHSSPAPGRLNLVRGFINTADLEDGWDRLADAAQFAQWMTDRAGIASSPEAFSSADLEQLRRVREALRAIVERHNEPGVPATAVDIPNLCVHASVGGSAETALQPAGSITDALILRLLLVIETAKASGEWRRLKACAKPSCKWAFYDRSKNGSARWCSMAVCGNRTKTRRYREKQHTPVPARSLEP